MPEALSGSTMAGSVLPAPFRCGPFAVRPEWIDENAHLNLAYYVLLFDWATDALWARIGLGDPLRAIGRGTFAVETHTLHRAELVDADRVTVAAQIVDCDEKRLHVAHEMRRERDGAIAAQQELMFVCADLSTRRVTTWPAPVLAGLRLAATSHAGLQRPEWLGRRVAMPKRA